MAEPTETLKNAEDIEIQEGEEIIEEVIEEEQVEWIGQEVVMEQDSSAYFNGEELIEGSIVDYEEAEPFDSFLPIRHGVPVFSLNLPDLMSKSINNLDSEQMILCFNKKCQRQLAVEGFLYTIKEYLSESQWNHWRCVNPHCFGEIRTTPEFRLIRDRHPHVENCVQDELQIRIRIAVYDARLMAEFTDTPLDVLYQGVQSRVKHDIPEAAELFPSFEILKPTLEDHRINKVYRKRFEMQNLKDKQRKMSMSANEVVYNENASGLMKFRRTKPFPASICLECNDQLISNNLPSQDHLIAHYMYTHDRRLTIERFEFKDLNTFDQYLREFNLLSRYKMKRMGLADENMYYLCAHDDRLAKNGVGRASRMQQQNNHCTAFIRIFDWRLVSKRDGASILIDYCLEHQPHDEVQCTPNKEDIDYYAPEVFLRDMDERRARTQKLMGDGQREKRPMEVRTYVPAGRAKPSFGTRSLAPPLAAQIAAGTSNPFVDIYEEQSTVNNRPRVKFRQSIRTAFPKGEEDQPGTSSSSDINLPPPPRVYVAQKAYTRLTERQNFKDIYTFNAVCKIEDTCMALLNRLQNCQSARVGIAYRDKLNAILRNANLDPALSDEAMPEDSERSWTLQRPARGRPKKRLRMGFEEESVGEDEEEEDDDVEKKGDVTMDMDEEMPEAPKEDGEIEKPLVKLVERAVKLEPQPSTSDAHNKPPQLEKKHPVKLETNSPIPNLTPNPLPTSEDSGAVTYEKMETTTRSGRQRKVPARLVE